VKELVEYLARALVADPDAVSVNEEAHGGVVEYAISVAPEDTGKVIGRQGRMIQAIRALVKAANTKSGRRTHVEIASQDISAEMRDDG
jgi:uncharacterized protein